MSQPPIQQHNALSPNPGRDENLTSSSTKQKEEVKKILIPFEFKLKLNEILIETIKDYLTDLQKLAIAAETDTQNPKPKKAAKIRKTIEKLKPIFYKYQKNFFMLMAQNSRSMTVSQREKYLQKEEEKDLNLENEVKKRHEEYLTKKQRMEGEDTKQQEEKLESWFSVEQKYFEKYSSIFNENQNQNAMEIEAEALENSEFDEITEEEMEQSLKNTINTMQTLMKEIPIVKTNLSETAEALNMLENTENNQKEKEISSTTKTTK